MKFRKNNFFISKKTETNFSPFFLLLFCLMFCFNFSFAQEKEIKLKHGVPTFKLSGIFSSKDASVKQKYISEYKTEILPSDFPEHDQEYLEELGKRTSTSRSFKGKTDGKIVILYGSKQLNYPDKENKLQPINTKLNFSSNGWSAPQQEFPTYLNTDGSTEISLSKNKMKFNLNCSINNVPVNSSDFTVGEDGMFVRNASPGIDKKIIFSENRIETDYIINQPLNSNQDLVISEEIEIPPGNIIYYHGENKKNEFVIYSSDNIEQARFNPPVFYDAKFNRVNGEYHTVEKNGKTFLQIHVPAAWLNDPARVYPVTIDPVVTGPTTNYPAIYMKGYPVVVRP
ncbi:MAG: hypothetical protein IAF38_15810, partial [Bacteroidia bacterium]|nr:hypothetical protein [Bacteroidia bacterium]